MSTGRGSSSSGHGAIEIADRVWWVAADPGDELDSHSYVIEAGNSSVWIDPGSAVTIDRTLDRVGELVPLDSIRWIVCHHGGPDLASGLPAIRRALPAADLRVVTDSHIAPLVDHYGAGIPIHRVDDHGSLLPLGGERRLRFVFAPYVQVPGSLCSYEESSGVLFSCDLFAAPHGTSDPPADDDAYYASMRTFHEQHLPSSQIVDAVLARITRSFDQIRLVAPRRGRLIPERLIASVFQQLSRLECGQLLTHPELETARLQDELRQLDLHDALTGLYNRNAIRLLAGMDEQFGVLTIEIDQLAAVRDRFGQGASDHVLQSVAASIVTSVRRRDATVRNGEEELLVLLDSADEMLTAAVAERIRLRIARLDFAAYPDVPPATVSIGAAIHHRGQPVEEGIADASDWLRGAKRDGGNRVSASWLTQSEESPG